MKQRAIIIFGPPGAGKGTQAEFLAERHGFHHFETSQVLETAFTQKDRDAIEVDGIVYPFTEEQRKFLAGELCTPEVVAYFLKEAIEDFARKGISVVFSGSPRTQYESEAILPVLEEQYGKEGICAFLLVCIPETSVARNSKRRICVVCRLPHPGMVDQEILRECRRCGGELMRRLGLDVEKIIWKRLQEFSERTIPGIDVARKRGIPVHELDAERKAEEVFKDIEEYLTK